MDRKQKNIAFNVPAIIEVCTQSAITFLKLSS